MLKDILIERCVNNETGTLTIIYADDYVQMQIRDGQILRAKSKNTAGIKSLDLLNGDIVHSSFSGLVTFPLESVCDPSLALIVAANKALLEIQKMEGLVIPQVSNRGY